MHQHAGDGFPHLGSVIIQAYNCVEVKSLRLISEAAYPLLAFSLVSSPPLLYGLDVTKLMCTVYMPPAEMKSAAGPALLTSLRILLEAFLQPPC